eukprot:12899931-Prorocentrum_lima.AAC.1
MFTVLSTATLLSEIESPEGTRYIVTEDMLLAAEQNGLMHLSEVRKFNAIDLAMRHYDRQTICLD